MKEEHILQALAALAENDREKEAPPEAEARLLSAFRARRIHLRRLWVGVATLAAGVVIALLVWPNRTPKPVVSTVRPVALMPETSPTREAEPVPTVVRAPRKLARKSAAPQPPQSREVVTDFFPLMNPAPSFERGEILRVQLPAAAMQTVGLPVREEHLGDLVQADVLVGEEGMPRAIRFVRFDVK